MSGSHLDHAGEITVQTDFSSLKDYLESHSELSVDNFEVKQFPSGFSNLTYLLICNGKEYVMRRPPIGANIKSAHDMGREFKVLSLLMKKYSYVPKPVLYCEDENVIGAPFYIMERVKGVILRSKPPEGLNLSSSVMKNLSINTVNKMVELHGLPLIDGLETLGKPEGYNVRQVKGWIKRYFAAETDDIPKMNFVSEWMNDQIPEYENPTLIHNDFKYDNLVLDSDDLTSIMAILDWEMATIGDPLMDVGTSLGYWAEADDNPALKYNLTWLPGNLTRQEFVDHYADQTGRNVDDILFYYVFGLFKIGVIVQQIYARYKKGLTKDPRFAQLKFVLEGCADTAYRAIEYKRISHLK
ncbi:phosphotransferase family protein [Marinigracilibium pacificum]|uniref:Phosphotransferase family protein n=1 Tax=Marinigracilibium pacificum TaxID=2729599 RepID=A0A848J3N7_9BACT|nr:phosphotransferase family protein [Marinigracilibium pacificum]NMM49938.1 phosphotransferase family protein [Marinigracilibium pacificum]